MKGVKDQAIKNNLIDFKLDHFSDSTVPHDPDEDAVELVDKKVRRQDSEELMNSGVAQPVLQLAEKLRAQTAVNNTETASQSITKIPSKHNKIVT